MSHHLHVVALSSTFFSLSLFDLLFPRMKSILQDPIGQTKIWICCKKMQSSLARKIKMKMLQTCMQAEKYISSTKMMMISISFTQAQEAHMR